MSNIIALNRVDEKSKICVFEYKGREAIIAKELGAYLGYASGGNKLSNLIIQEWDDSFIRDQDYAVITGTELSDLKKIFNDKTPYGLSFLRSNKIMILFVSGVHMVAIRSSKPEALVFHRWLVDSVLSQVAIDGKFDPDRKVENGEIVHVNHKIPKTYGEALILAGQLEMEKERLLLENKQMEPYAIFGESVIDTGASYSISSASKATDFVVGGSLRQIGPRKMLKWLMQLGVIYKEKRDYLPKQEQINRGRFEVKLIPYTNEKTGRKGIRKKLLVTTKGHAYLTLKAQKDPLFMQLSSLVDKEFHGEKSNQLAIFQ